MKCPSCNAEIDDRVIAQHLGKKGGGKGGLATAKKMTPEQLKERARNAARARWGVKHDG